MKNFGSEVRLSSEVHIATQDCNYPKISLFNAILNFFVEWGVIRNSSFFFVYSKYSLVRILRMSQANLYELQDHLLVPSLLVKFCLQFEVPEIAIKSRWALLGALSLEFLILLHLHMLKLWYLQVFYCYENL